MSQETPGTRPFVRGYLLHMTHYDPVWVRGKADEEPFDPAVARAVVDALAEQGFNTLFIGVSDGVVYRSHPEWRRSYSQPMDVLRSLADYARGHGMQVIPKLNFSRSEVNCHNHWMRAPGEMWHEHFDDDVAWQRAADAIDEVIDACQPEQFFHVGMDEDHDRSYTQYVRVTCQLHDLLAERGLRTVCWSDSALDYPSGDIYREKSEAAEADGPDDMVRLLWNYWNVPVDAMRQIRSRGLELWGAPGWKEAEQVTSFRDALLANGGTGLVMTRWIPCVESNREQFLDLVRTLGPLYG